MYIYIYTHTHTQLCEISWFLGAFATLRKATISLVMSVVCPSIRQPARMEELGSHWTESHEI